MHTIYHIACDPLAEVPAGELVTDSREYAEYFGRIKCRRECPGTCFIHRAQAGFHELAYAGREPLGDANLYRMKAAVPVKDVVPLPLAP